MGLCGAYRLTTLLLCALQYFFVIFLFAVLYLNISKREAACHVGLSTLMEAYIFSLETIVRDWEAALQDCPASD